MARHRALAFQFQRAARLEHEAVAKPLPECLGHVHAPDHAAAFHAACSVDRVTPEVVRELLLGNHAADGGAGVDADAQIQRHARVASDAFAGGEHVQCHAGDPVGVIRCFLGNAGCGHVGIADGLDLFDAITLGDLVERLEQRFQHLDQLGRRQFRGHPREADDVGKHHRHVVVELDDMLLAALQAVGDRPGQDVAQQVVGAAPLFGQRLAQHEVADSCPVPDFIGQHRAGRQAERIDADRERHQRVRIHQHDADDQHREAERIRRQLAAAGRHDHAGNHEQDQRVDRDVGGQRLAQHRVPDAQGKRDRNRDAGHPTRNRGRRRIAKRARDQQPRRQRADVGQPPDHQIAVHPVMLEQAVEIQRQVVADQCDQIQQRRRPEQMTDIGQSRSVAVLGKLGLPLVADGLRVGSAQGENASNRPELGFHVGSAVSPGE